MLQNCKILEDVEIMMRINEIFIGFCQYFQWLSIVIAIVFQGLGVLVLRAHAKDMKRGIRPSYDILLWRRWIVTGQMAGIVTICTKLATSVARTLIWG